MRSFMSSIRSALSDHKKPSQYRSWSNNLKQVMKLKLNPLFEDLKKTTSDQQRKSYLKQICDTLKGLDETSCLDYEYVYEAGEQAISQTKEVLLDLWSKLLDGIDLVQVSEINSIFFSVILWIMKRQEFDYTRSPSLLLLYTDPEDSDTESQQGGVTPSQSPSQSPQTSSSSSASPTPQASAGGASDDPTFALASRYRNLLLSTLRFVTKNIERAIDLCLPRKNGGGAMLPISFLTAARRLRSIPQPIAPAPPVTLATSPTPPQQQGASGSGSSGAGEDKKGKKKSKKSQRKGENGEEGDAGSNDGAGGQVEKGERKKKHKKSGDDGNGGEERKKKHKKSDSGDGTEGSDERKKKHKHGGDEGEKGERKKKKHKERKERKEEEEEEGNEENAENEEEPAEKVKEQSGEDGEDENGEDEKEQQAQSKGGEDGEDENGEDENGEEKEDKKGEGSGEGEDEDGENEGDDEEAEDPKDKQETLLTLQQTPQQSLHSLMPRRAPTSVMTPLFTSFSTKVLAFIYFRFPYIQSELISSITKDLVENDEIKFEKPKECMQPSAIPTLLSYKPYNDAITKWNSDNGKDEENNFESLFAKRYIIPDGDSDNSDSETEIDNWLDLLSKRSELFIEFFVECINYVNSITRSQRITFNWLELPGFYELFASYFSLYKGQRTFMEESISCPSVLSMLSDAMDSDSEGGPQQQSPLQAQQRPKPQIPVKYFTACENVLMSIPDMRIINYLIKKAYTTSSVFSISSVASCFAMIETWLSSMNKYGVKVNDDFDIKFLCEGLDIVFRMDHYILLTKVLISLYNTADIFRGKSRLELFGNLLMDKYFYHLFFYWEENTRNIFMQLILFRLLSAKRSQVRYEIKKRKKDKDFIDPTLTGGSALPYATSTSPTPGSQNDATSSSTSSNNGNFSDPVNIILLKRYDAYVRKIEDMKAVMDANESLIMSGWVEASSATQSSSSSSKKSKRSAGSSSGTGSQLTTSQGSQAGGLSDSYGVSRRKKKEFVVEDAPTLPVPNIVSGYTAKSDAKESPKEAKEGEEAKTGGGGGSGEGGEEPEKKKKGKKKAAVMEEEEEVTAAAAADGGGEKKKKAAEEESKDKVEGNGENVSEGGEDQEKQEGGDDAKKKKRDKKAEKAEKKQAKKDRKAAAQNGRGAAEEIGEKVPDIPQNLLKYMDVAYEDFKRQQEKYKAWESKSISEPPKIMSFN